MSNPTNPQEIVYTPAEISSLGMDELQARRDGSHPGIPTYTPADKFLNPMRPGDLVVILARPSHYKTGILLYTMRKHAQKIARDQATNVAGALKRMALYVTWEISIEEAALLDLAHATRLDAARLASGELEDAEWYDLEEKAAKRQGFPLWMLGHSMANRRKRPIITMDTVIGAIRFIEDQMDFEVDIIGLDYLNQIPTFGKDDRRLQVSDTVLQSKDLARHTGCPVILNAQAKREVDERKSRQPLMGDGMETSNIEHTADKIHTLEKLDMNYQPGETVDWFGKTVVVEEGYVSWFCAKERFGRGAGKPCLMKVDAATNNIVGEVVIKDINDVANKRLDGRK